MKLVETISQMFTLSEYGVATLCGRGAHVKGAKGKSWLWLPKEWKGRPCLVAHIDTVPERWPKNEGYIRSMRLFHDTAKGVIWSPDGLGADDRAGVWALQELWNNLPEDKQPMVLLTTDEESGGGGARDACEGDIATYLSEASCFIELDRAGTKHFVCYNTESQDWIEWIEAITGWEYNKGGTFSDISILGKHYQVCSVNIATGYYQQHSNMEHLYLNELNDAIGVTVKLIYAAIDKGGKWAMKYEPQKYETIFRSRLYDDDWYSEFSDEHSKGRKGASTWRSGMVWSEILRRWCWPEHLPKSEKKALVAKAKAEGEKKHRVSTVGLKRCRCGADYFSYGGETECRLCRKVSSEVDRSNITTK